MSLRAFKHLQSFVSKSAFLLTLKPSYMMM